MLTSSHIRLCVQHEKGIMQARSEQNPAPLALSFFYRHPPTLVILLFQIPALCTGRPALHPIVEICQDLLPILFKVVALQARDASM